VVAYIWRKKTGALDPVIINEATGDQAKGGFISCENYHLEKHRKGSRLRGPRCLPEMADVLTEEDIFGFMP
jgi:hypothetical protein